MEKGKATLASDPGHIDARRRKVLVVDDHPIVRERLIELLNLESDLIGCGEAEDPQQALAAIKSTNPDIVIIDISLRDSNGIDLIRDIKARHSNLPILVLSMHDETLYAERAIRAGARGYITKHEASANIVKAIRRILSGEIFLSEAVAANILQRLAGMKADGDASPTDRLTDREFQVFQMLGKGMGVKQIAANLKLSVKTVETHREHIKVKLKFKNSRELLRYAIEHALKHS